MFNCKGTNYDEGDRDPVGNSDTRGNLPGDDD